MSLPNLSGLRLASDGVSTGEWVEYKAGKYEDENANTPAGRSECAISRNGFEEHEYIWRSTRAEGCGEVNYDGEAYWHWLQNSQGLDPANRHPLDRETMLDLLRGPPKGGDSDDRRPLIDEERIEAEVDELLEQRTEAGAERRRLEEARRQIQQMEAESEERRLRIQRARAPPPSWVTLASAGYEGASAHTLLSTDITANPHASRYGVDAELINFVTELQADVVTRNARWYYLEQPVSMLPENNHRGVVYEWKPFDSQGGVAWPSLLQISIKLQAGSFINGTLANWDANLPQGNSEARLRLGMLRLLFGQNLNAYTVDAALHHSWFRIAVTPSRSEHNNGLLSIYIRPEFMAWLCDRAGRLDSSILPELRERFGQAPAHGFDHGAEPPHRSLSVAMTSEDSVTVAHAQRFWKNALTKMISLVQGLPGWVHGRTVTHAQTVALKIYVAPSPMLEARVPATRPRMRTAPLGTQPLTPWMQRRWETGGLAYVETLWYGRGYDTDEEGWRWEEDLSNGVFA